MNQTRHVWKKERMIRRKYTKMKRDKQIFVMLSSYEKLKEHRFTVKQKILKNR